MRIEPARLTALLKMLTDSGDITPMGVHLIEQIREPEAATLHQLLLTTGEIKVLLQALALASMEASTGDDPADDWPLDRWARLVWGFAHSPDASPFQQALTPLATALDELLE